MVNPDQWITGSNSVKGSREEGRVRNTYLKNLETNVYKAINPIELAGKEVTLEALKANIKGGSEKTHSLIGSARRSSAFTDALLRGPASSKTQHNVICLSNQASCKNRPTTQL